jgi:hypothetical protein
MIASRCQEASFKSVVINCVVPLLARYWLARAFYCACGASEGIGCRILVSYEAFRLDERAARRNIQASRRAGAV